MFITVKTISKLNLEHVEKVEIKIQKLVLVVHVLQTTENLVLFRNVSYASAAVVF